MALRVTSFILMLIAGAANALAQNKASEIDEIWGELNQNSSPQALRLALPQLAAATENVTAEAAEVSRIMFDDILFASVFRIANREHHGMVETYDLGFNYYGWESIGAQIVVTGTLSREGQALRAAIHVHDIGTQKTIFSTVYTEYRGAVRNLAHQIADRVLAQFGNIGVATTRIAFASGRGSESGSKSLWLMDYDGVGQHAITSNRYLDFQPRYSPDGSTLSFLSFRRKNAPPVVAIHGEARTLLEGPGQVFSASWSPDGKRVAFSSTRDHPGNSEIYVMNRDGSKIRRLTNHPGTDVSPTWSPTGDAIAFTSERTGSPQIFTMGAEGMRVRRLSLKGSYNAEPAWSPSKLSQEIAYASRVDGRQFDIVVHDLTTRQVRQLTSRSGLNEGPSWSPDGRHLAFTSTRSGEPQIFIMNRNGSNQRQLTVEGSNTTPAWSPQPELK